MVKAELKKELISLALPSISYLDIFWSLRDERIFLYTSSNKASEIFIKLFRKSIAKQIDAEVFIENPAVMSIPDCDWKSNKAIHNRLEKYEVTTYLPFN